MEQYYKIALLFNANKIYDRGVLAGIGQYIQASKASWDIFMEDDFTYQKNMIQNLAIDGVIADFDDPETATLLKNITVPIVAVGGSYRNPDYYPDLPYIATDNHALVELALAHLKEKGISQFAFYGLPASENHWAKERESAFLSLMEQENKPAIIFQGELTNSCNWSSSQEKLCEWIQTLPDHTGIIAVTDARARHILQACQYLNRAVPEQLCIIGIDNEELIQYLSNISLSSVEQGTNQIGYHAAKTLHRMLNGIAVRNKPILIPPMRVIERQSTDYRSVQDPLVMQAMYFIRQRACQGIKTEQVLDYLRISRTNLEQRFKEEMGKTIHQVIHQEKMQRACQLLVSDIPIQEIAEVCGYPSVQYFYSVFKKENLLTPKEYREKFMGKGLG